MKTIEAHLERVKEDFIRLTAEANKDGLHEEALRAQAIATQIDAFIEASQIPGHAKWPPRVTVERQGGIKNTSWSCVE